MWFSLFSTILILAITFYQGLQGLFTGLINCILAILSAALAFGLYENVYFSFLADRQPDYGRAIALVGIFVVTLLVLRTVVDALIKGNVHLPVYVDRAGGGLFGLVTALIIVGMLGIGFQMLPFPPDFLGFSRLKVVDRESGEPIAWRGKKGEEPPMAGQDWSKVDLVRQRTWLNAGGFTASLASHLSANALRGREDVSFAEVHPDFLSETFAAKAHPLGASRLTAKPDSLQVSASFILPPSALFQRERIDRAGKKFIKLKKAQPPESGEQDVAIRVSIRDARDEGGDVVRFTPEVVRLLVRADEDGPVTVYHPIGINDDSPGAGNNLVQIYPGEPIARAEGETDFVFRLPEGARVLYLEFKQDARDEVPLPDEKKPWTPIGAKAPPVTARPPRPDQIRPTEPPAGSGSSGSGGTYGRVNVLGPAEGLSITDALPFNKPLTSYGGGQAQISNGVVKGVRDLVSDLGADWQPQAGNQPPIERFEVPEGMRLLQVSVERLQAGSTYGRALSFAIENVGDFYLKGQDGKEFRPVGIYAMANVGGRNVFEMTYLDATERDMTRIPKFNRIKSADLQGNYALVYLFHVPPGTRPVEIHTGRRPVDLRQFNVEVK